jgi:hypothetical protein
MLSVQDSTESVESINVMIDETNVRKVKEGSKDSEEKDDEEDLKEEEEEEEEEEKPEAEQEEDEKQIPPKTPSR